MNSLYYFFFHHLRFTVAVALRIVRSTIMKRCGFDILKLRPVDNVEECFVPAVFICGNQDRFIHPSHSQDIYAGYGSEDKNLIQIEGKQYINIKKENQENFHSFFLSKHKIYKN